MNFTMIASVRVLFSDAAHNCVLAAVDTVIESLRLEAVLEFIDTMEVGNMTEEAKIGYGLLVEPWVGDAGHDE